MGTETAIAIGMIGVIGVMYVLMKGCKEKLYPLSVLLFFSIFGFMAVMLNAIKLLAASDPDIAATVITSMEYVLMAFILIGAISIIYFTMSFIIELLTVRKLRAMGELDEDED